MLRFDKDGENTVTAVYHDGSKLVKREGITKQMFKQLLYKNKLVDDFAIRVLKNDFKDIVVPEHTLQLYKLNSSTTTSTRRKIDFSVMRERGLLERNTPENQSIVDTVEAFVKKLSDLCPDESVAYRNVRFIICNLLNAETNTILHKFGKPLDKNEPLTKGHEIAKNKSYEWGVKVGHANPLHKAIYDDDPSHSDKQLYARRHELWLPYEKNDSEDKERKSSILHEDDGNFYVRRESNLVLQLETWLLYVLNVMCENPPATISYHDLDGRLMTKVYKYASANTTNVYMNRTRTVLPFWFGYNVDFSSRQIIRLRSKKYRGTKAIIPELSKTTDYDEMTINQVAINMIHDILKNPKLKLRSIDGMVSSLNIDIKDIVSMMYLENSANYDYTYKEPCSPKTIRLPGEYNSVNKYLILTAESDNTTPYSTDKSKTDYEPSEHKKDEQSVEQTSKALFAPKAEKEEVEEEVDEEAELKLNGLKGLNGIKGSIESEVITLLKQIVANTSQNSGPTSGPTSVPTSDATPDATTSYTYGSNISLNELLNQLKPVKARTVQDRPSYNDSDDSLKRDIENKNYKLKKVKLGGLDFMLGDITEDNYEEFFNVNSKNFVLILDVYKAFFEDVEFKQFSDAEIVQLLSHLNKAQDEQSKHSQNEVSRVMSNSSSNLTKKLGIAPAVLIPLITTAIPIVIPMIKKAFNFLKSKFTKHGVATNELTDELTDESNNESDNESNGYSTMGILNLADLPKDIREKSLAEFSQYVEL